MRRLRAECAWKAGQTHRSLARYLLEETYETLEAIDTGDADHLREELGDLLLQVYFHAVIAEEAGEFTLDDVADGIADKMHRRNPHVFGRDAGAPRAPADGQRAVGGVKADREAAHLASSTASPPTLPALLLRRQGPRPPRARRGRAAASPGPRADLGDRLLALVAEAARRGRRPRAGAPRRRTPAA